MSTQQNIDRIQTTHVGSLPRPHRLLDLMKARLEGRAVDQVSYSETLSSAVVDCVKAQMDCGIDVVTDGEFSKTGFYTYLQDRLEGFEERAGQKLKVFEKEIAAFPEYYEDYFKGAMIGGALRPIVPVICTGPVRYRGEKLLQTDIANLKAAARAAGVPEGRVFMPATAPSGVGLNEYYKSEEDYFQALAAAISNEYRAIVAAGFLLQVDDPFLPDIFMEPGLDQRQMNKKAAIYIEAINEGLKEIPPEKVRFHTCYGINHGPRIHEAMLGDFVEHMLCINAGSYSFEAANPRHEHEYHLFERVRLPYGKVLIPGVITHASNIVEHPELIAERIVRLAKLVGRENVIAGADCGFSSQALYKPEVNPRVIWAKFKAMRQGADIATKQLWS